MGRFESGRWDILIADSYRFGKRDWRALRLQARELVVIDDSGRTPCDCDWVLNGQPFAPELTWKSKRRTSLMLGAKFLPLRREYWRHAGPRRHGGPIKKLLVTLGGGRSALVKGVVETSLRELPKAQVHAVLGPHCAPPRLRDARLTWHQGLASLRPLIAACDAAVSGGGQTLYELATTGTPAIAIPLAANQYRNVSSLADAGVVLSAGRAATRLAPALRKLDRLPGLRQEMSGLGQALIDGRGALRVARALCGDAA